MQDPKNNAGVENTDIVLTNNKSIQNLHTTYVFSLILNRLEKWRDMKMGFFMD